MKLLPLLSVCVLGTFLLTACNSNHKYPQAPAMVKASPSNMDYKLGPLDQIDIFVWRSPELSSSLSIRPDGRISIPLIEDMQAAGKTPTQLAREIEQKLKKYVQDPMVTVIVSDFAGSLDQQVRIVGQSEQPSAIPYRAGMTVLDVMIAVGGLRETASGNNAVLVRKEKGKQISYGLKLDDLIRNGQISANVPVAPGDVIIIPESYL